MSRLGPFELDTIVVGDCLDVMRQMPDGCVDAVITDPPYGMKKADWDMAIVPVASWLPTARQLGPVSIFTGVKGAFDYPKPDWIMAWVRQGSTQRNGKLRGFNNWEPILLYGVERLANDVIAVPNLPDEDSRGHPTPKPLGLITKLLRRLTKHGDLISDPFIGSGTTAVAAKKLGRHYFGCDINPEYVEMAMERIAKIDGVQLELIP